MRHSKLQRQVDGAMHETEEAAVRLLGALGRSEHAKSVTAQTPAACQSLVPVTAPDETGFVCRALQEALQEAAKRNGLEPL